MLTCAPNIANTRATHDVSKVGKEGVTQVAIRAAIFHDYMVTEYPQRRISLTVQYVYDLCVLGMCVLNYICTQIMNSILSAINY